MEKIKLDSFPIPQKVPNGYEIYFKKNKTV